ncbi:MAG TPA: DUF4288 domain-containing protein [Aggregicoccus sp.]|nr:DUF4288 domain-containing protein [Aggregicoccus sp.]
MTWYAVSAILYFRYKDVERQDEFYVWENVYLVHASGPEEAGRKAEALGRAEQTADPSMTLNERPAELVFGGIRKVISCAATISMPGSGLVEQVHDGMEATYSGFTVGSREALDALIAGDPVTVRYEE